MASKETKKKTLAVASKNSKIETKVIPTVASENNKIEVEEKPTVAFNNSRIETEVKKTDSAITKFIKIIGIIVSIITIVVGALTIINYCSSKAKDKKEEERRRLEELDNTHENLTLSFQCMPIIKKEYNADIIIPIPNSQHDEEIIFLLLDIFNRGRKTANNTELTMCIKNDFYFEYIMSNFTMEGKDTIYPQKNLVKFEFKRLNPNSSVSPMIFIKRKDGHRFFNGQSFSMCHTLSCDNKLHPIEFDVNYRIYMCNSVPDYLKLIKESNINDVEYFHNKDFVICYSVDSEKKVSPVLEIVEKTNDSYILKGCTPPNNPQSTN
jgi:hypothetical protein